jgi:hypothetical protein
MRLDSAKSRLALASRAMTLPELLVSLTILVMAIAGLISVNIFGMRYDELTNSKLGATDQSRLNFNLMMEEIRAGKNVLIGSGSFTNFTPVTNGLAQRGDTIQILPTTNLTTYIYYYFETNAPTNSSWLIRISTTNGGTTYTSNLVAQSITNLTSLWLTNACCFQALDYTGTNILMQSPTNYTHNYVVAALVQFYQYQYPLTRVGSNYLFNYYQIQFMAARRSP